ILERLWSDLPKNNSATTEVEKIRQRALDLQATFPLPGFLLVSSFLLIIAVFGAMLGQQNSASPISPSYVYVPGLLFIVIFFSGSVTFLSGGKRKIGRIIGEATELRNRR
ncbi:MAG: hypothetical protein M3014_00265, partial [Chloroflexota bacterium]|nr:hypothetical protein [Chloroflexota bacterium]